MLFQYLAKTRNLRIFSIQERRLSHRSNFNNNNNINNSNRNQFKPKVKNNKQCKINHKIQNHPKTKNNKLIKKKLIHNCYNFNSSSSSNYKINKI